MVTGRRGVYPGSFDPLTTAHVAIVDAAIEVCQLDQLDLVLSVAALAKAPGGHTPLDVRVAEITRALGSRSGVRARTSSLQLLADLAEGYDVCILGADKWQQLHDVAFYDGSAAARDAALARLPRLAVAPRHGVPSPPPGPAIVLLDLDPRLQEVSSTAVRAGRDDWRA